MPARGAVGPIGAVGARGGHTFFIRGPFCALGGFLSGGLVRRNSDGRGVGGKGGRPKGAEDGSLVWSQPFTGRGPGTIRETFLEFRVLPFD